MVGLGISEPSTVGSMGLVCLGLMKVDRVGPLRTNESLTVTGFRRTKVYLPTFI